MALFYVLCKDKKEGKRIALTLLNERLIACANMIRSESLYFWKNKSGKNKLEVSGEYVLLLKTADRLSKKLSSRIKEIHSYDIPCILKIGAVPNKEYSDWVESQVRGRATMQQRKPINRRK